MLRVSDPDLIAHWPFRENLKDHSESGPVHSTITALKYGESGGQIAPNSTGRKPFLEVPCDLVYRGQAIFHAPAGSTRKKPKWFGDILSQFGSGNPPGVAGLGPHQYRNDPSPTAQSNYRNLHFGIDNGHLGAWTDCGRPGQAVKISAHFQQ